MNRAAIVLAACLASAAIASASAASESCNLSAETDWQAGQQKFRVEAHSNGDDCAQAVVTLIVRDAKGGVLWTDSAPADHVMIFADVKSPGDMMVALASWIGEEQPFATTADLAEWKQGADQPILGELYFYPEPGVDRAYYEAQRAARLPVFSYVQGMESMAVIVLQTDGRMEKLGAQSFPG
ncbi:MAG: hypothetical protein U1E87_08930 [Alphaproteobacteria bacterium]